MNRLHRSLPVPCSDVTGISGPGVEEKLTVRTSEEGLLAQALLAITEYLKVLYFCWLVRV